MLHSILQTKRKEAENGRRRGDVDFSREHKTKATAGGDVSTDIHQVNEKSGENK